ncbi:ATP-grasp fold amidoligase family protein [Rhodohalobacter sp. 8-1]|uniref:ATP-grasp fold amidoligase family protein n=1 Tax=Rhodohalobacter sp. 8-1 TaxID=3131972 RepID=UPI0030EC820E
MNLKTTLKKYLRRVLFRLLPELRSLDTGQKELRFDMNHLTDHYDTHSPEFLKKRDAELIKRRFRKILSYEPDLENPKTFNEKTQWLKIHYRKKGIHKLADKYAVRNYLSGLGYEKYLNTLFGVYTSSEELLEDWKNLPSSFVVKANHWSGGNFIIRDKETFNKNKLKKLDEWMRKNYYHFRRWGEWVYKDIEPCIIAEKYLTTGSSGDVKDFRLLCFNGKVKYITVDVDTLGNTKRAFYDLNWQKQDFTIKRPIYPGEITRPAALDEMIRFAETVSKDHPFLRVDLYIPDSGQIVFGELTFFHQSGFGEFIPQRWDRKLGDLIDLPLA